MAMSDYLWDKSGSDAEVEALEGLLAPARLEAPRVRPSRRLALVAGIAAAALFAFGVAGALKRAPLDNRWVAQEDGRRRLDLGRFGEVLAEPGAKVRVVRMDENLQSLRLDRGTIHASITRAARPRLFQVETPAATCIDLGCHYSLSVDRQGVTQVKVETGRVLFDHGARDVFIPEGASCKAAPGRAPFTPIHDNASEPLRKAVEAFDAARVGRRGNEAKVACDLILRREDGLVAWHFLQDPEKSVVGHAREALVRLTTVPECGIPRPKANAADELRAWRDSLFPEWSTWD
jgi:ferric-dicitrate binding protein FerR (iron transport regulator)